MDSDWPIFVLTLEGDDLRRQALIDALDAANLAHRLFFGVDGRNGLAETYQPLIDRAAATRRMGRAMTDGEFACALSHRLIYETILSEGLEGAVILEDDAIPGPDFPAFLAAGCHRCARLALLDYRFGRALPWQRQRRAQWDFYRAAQRPTLASAYSVSRLSAADLLAASTPVSYVADWPTDLHQLGAELVVPRPVEHRPPGAGPSHLEAQRSVADHQTKNPRRHLNRAYWKNFLRRKLARKVGR
ncbi:glycosyltransferase family 25 protein [Paracoccus sp. SCSIO 75233]|uniref:glycosyltransferase family 25 protein n=1 Tax=Paracoccus sp. SCSIO 75233 TaxID=3017782 RepID=UPI0022F11FC8|nr:glycosyltransferase family 25 protein [Paracoccus sp. SCSIO 75233]WBU53383.1 glycosyltransferase family 25 protein [Paracoccus sp. SCSIO 75233]